MSAIATFRRALSVSPEYPAAMFGLAEAYRAQGENIQAIEQYKHYLSVAPSGADAHAARGQLKALEAAPPRRAEPSPTAVIPGSSDPTAPPAVNR
jgi:tetratricopeptide (TPR) repeat protein